MKRILFGLMLAYTPAFYAGITAALSTNSDKVGLGVATTVFIIGLDVIFKGKQ